jgi:hypothetical protein
MVLDSNRGQETLDPILFWVGVTDYVNLDIYPCYQGQACRFDYERQVIAAADSAGLVYWVACRHSTTVRFAGRPLPSSRHS